MKIFLFLSGLLVPVIMLIAGWFMHRHPPKNINCAIGYRTGRSMKSPEAWMFAQKKTGAIWKKVGATALISSAAVQIPFFFLSADAFSIALLVLMFIQLFVLFMTIPPVERALKKEFPDTKK